MNGPEVTVIQGAAAPGGGNGDGAIRCAYVGANGLLSGFRLTNGHTRTSGDWREYSGGGAQCEQSGVLTNCVLTGNSAADNGTFSLKQPIRTNHTVVRFWEQSLH